MLMFPTAPIRQSDWQKHEVRYLLRSSKLVAMDRKATTIRFDDVTINNLPSFLELVAQHRTRVEEELGSIPLWFRGHRNEEWKLETTLKRQGIIPEREPQLLNRFRQNAVNYLGSQHPRDEATWDWLFLMRHHGAPSRLLDWTESALIGLYFAVEQRPRGPDLNRKQKPGHVWVLLPTVLNSNGNVRDPESNDDRSVPMFALTADSGLNIYEPSNVSRNANSSVPPAAGQGIRSFPRMEAQQSSFTVHHADQKALEEWHDKMHIWRYLVPADAKAGLRADLRAAGINRLALFRDLDSAAWVAEEALNV